MASTRRKDRRSYARFASIPNIRPRCLLRPYNGQPLCYVAIAAQKHYLSLYLMTAYGDPAKKKQLESGFARAGKKLDMGKACMRFRSLDDLPLDTVADIIASTPVDADVAAYERSRKGRARRT